MRKILLLLVGLFASVATASAQTTALRSAGDCQTESTAAVMLLMNARDQNASIDSVLARGSRGQSATMIDLAYSEDPAVVRLARVGADLDQAGVADVHTTADASTLRTALAGVCNRAGSGDLVALAW